MTVLPCERRLCRGVTEESEPCAYVACPPSDTLPGDLPGDIDSASALRHLSTAAPSGDCPARSPVPPAGPFRMGSVLVPADAPNDHGRPAEGAESGAKRPRT